VAALRHRGPDQEGVSVDDDAVLGVARLAIIDVRHGMQPLRDPEAGTVLACNGEIYGHRDIRAATPEYPYRTGSDAEVVLALHRRHGTNLLEHLPGTFALALWDDHRHELLLARDRFGERPLYWARTAEGLLVFASELRALTASGLVERRLDRRVLAHVLRQGYVPPGHCIWQGIGSLAPGARLRWAGGEPDVERWWDPPAVEDDPGMEAAVEWFRAELDRAVLEQMEADVPLGTFLSGGIDSSTIAVLAGRHRPGVQAFAFDMPESSEVVHARAVADRHDLDLHVCRPEFGAQELPGLLLETSRVWDEPFADSSSLPTWLLSRFARERVTVALTGDGADELLGGYLCWARDCLEPGDPARPGTTSPGPERRGPRALLGRMRRGGGSAGAAAPGGARPAGAAVAGRYARFRQYLTADQLVELGLPAVDQGPVDLERYPYGTADDISRFDIDHYLPGDILVKTDRASMAHGLEVRSPFLDVRVAEGCLRLPATLKVDATQEKVLLRRAFGDLLPRTATDRPKQGFGAPMKLWLQSPGVAELVQAYLTDPASPLFELVEPGPVQELAADADQRTWNLLTVAMWWDHQRTGAES
jgi:asparagine synthase (glutamine-hydrolysing)